MLKQGCSYFYFFSEVDVLPIVTTLEVSSLDDPCSYNKKKLHLPDIFERTMSLLAGFLWIIVPGRWRMHAQSLDLVVIAIPSALDAEVNVHL